MSDHDITVSTVLALLTFASSAVYWLMARSPTAVRSIDDINLVGFGVFVVGLGWLLHPFSHFYLQGAWVLMLVILAIVNTLALWRGRNHPE